ncbi:MAG: acetyl-CoA carboxylase carboxyl transferase subunit beta [Oscillospiraceae bacterium]|jgi:acetyl-CoA carboxylase carboxyl transferase subunit beta|nr:acetyl-CoA carboxylase carboxyl transferase subunit beta [Oscillospiraceae bacterium]
MIFKKPKNALESERKDEKAQIIADAPEVEPQAEPLRCPRCLKSVSPTELETTHGVCPLCRNHFPMSPRERIALLADRDTFEERDADVLSANVLNFPDYDKKLAEAREASGEPDAVVTGTCRVAGREVAVFAMNPAFMMGSMGYAVGEKLTRLFELAAERSLPVVGYTASGGARMQEGMTALLQMAKTSAAVRRHGDLGNLYVCVLTDPTTGGVTASFAMQGDIILAEPFARIAFAGPRVIEQTTRRKLPQGFQSAEFLLEHGFVDQIVDRRRQRQYIAELLRLHAREVLQ